jgi:hypothetical protein
MDRLAALFEQLAVPEIMRILRRTAIVSLAIGGVALIVLSLLGEVLIGLGACIGLGLGLANIRLVTSSVVRIQKSGTENTRRPLASHTLLRLGVTTVVVLAMLLTVWQLGVGAVAGLAVFYFVFLGNVMKSLLAKGVAA